MSSLKYVCQHVMWIRRFISVLVSQIRMAHRLIGVAGCFVLYSFFTSPKPRNQQMRRIAEILLGLYTFMAVYSLVESEEDKAAFLKLFPGGMVTLYGFVIAYCVVAMCYLPGYFVYDASQVFCLVLLTRTAFIDCNVDYWTKRRGMDFWNQFKLIADNVCIVMGLVMYLTCVKKTLYTDSADNDVAAAADEEKKSH